MTPERRPARPAGRVLDTANSGFRITAQLLLWIGSALGMAAVGMAVASVLFGMSPVVVQSGSMSPAYETGDLGLARQVPSHRLEVGDVVTVVDARDVRVTHRIVAIEHFDDHAELVLKGDANGALDPHTVAVTGADRVVLRIPKGGAAIEWLMSPPGMLTAGILVGTLMFIGFILPPDTIERPRRRRRARQRRQAVATAAAMALVATTVATPSPHRTFAHWTDTASATTGAFTAYTVASPTTAATPCTANNQLLTRSATVRWNGVAPTAGGPGTDQYEYVVRLFNRATGELVNTRVFAHSGGPGAVHQSTYTTTLLNLQLPNTTTLYRVEVESRLIGSAWTGGTVATIDFRATTSLLMQVTFTCES